MLLLKSRCCFFRFGFAVVFEGVEKPKVADIYCWYASLKWFVYLEINYSNVVFTLEAIFNWGLGFGVWGLGFGVWGLGFGVWVLQSDRQPLPGAPATQTQTAPAQTRR